MAKVVGYDKSITFKVVGAVLATTVYIRNTDWKERVRLLDSADTSTGGFEAYVAGLFGGDFSMEALYDAASMPHLTAPGIRAGAKADLTLNVGGAAPYTIPLIIESTGPRTAHDGLISYSFSAKLDGTPGRSAYVRSTAAA